MSRAHSKLGASKADRWLNCPGSVALCDTVPEAPSSKYADEGSAAHWFAELCLADECDAADMIGEECPEYPEFPMTVEMAEAVDVYVQHCRALICDRKGPFHWVEWDIEHRFALTDIDDSLFGTVDFYAFDPMIGHLDVRDYKHGACVLVSPVENAQVMYYALGALQLYGDQVRSVTIGIIQPRAPGKPVKTWSPSLDTLARYADTLRHGVEATREHDAPLSAGTWCRFCDAKPVCPKYSEGVDRGPIGARGRSAAADFGGLPDLEKLIG